jgi:hypothetical protein
LENYLGEPQWFDVLNGCDDIVRLGRFLWYYG